MFHAMGQCLRFLHNMFLGLDMVSPYMTKASPLNFMGLAFSFNLNEILESARYYFDYVTNGVSRFIQSCFLVRGQFDIKYFLNTICSKHC
jgi:hypothetical protein